MEDSQSYSTVRVHLLRPCATTFDPSALGLNCVQLGSIFGVSFVAYVRSDKTGQNRAKPDIFACTRAKQMDANIAVTNITCCYLADVIYT